VSQFFNQLQVNHSLSGQRQDVTGKDARSILSPRGSGNISRVR
jgi:hypothetical protein